MLLRTSLSSHKVGQLMSSVFHDVFLSLPGPIPATIIDFWQMVWQERPPTVVMVTNLKEGNKKKCEQYWPDSGSTTFGPFKVTLTEQQVFADYAIRMLLLTVRTVTACCNTSRISSCMLHASRRFKIDHIFSYRN